MVSIGERMFNITFDEDKSSVKSLGNKKFSIPVKIPLEENIREFTYRILYNNKIPHYLFDGL